MEALLNAKGFSTLKAANGKQAIDSAINHKPDIIILDILMPHMSGIEAIIAIKSNAELKNIPVVAVTACGLGGDRDRIISSGFDFYLLKPFTISLFINTIENALGN
jgi:CheY-like chemotaxis protein